MLASWSTGLGSAHFLMNARSRSISPENPHGDKGAGGKAASRLGTGRKGRAFISLRRDETVSLAEIQGPGVITHLWMTVSDQTPEANFVLRDLVLRMYWDSEETPSVEVPLGDFFCNGFGTRCVVNSLPIVVAPSGGMNCYFPMPFREGAKIAIASDHPADIEAFFYQVDFLLTDELPERAAYFHAQRRREKVTTPKRDYTVVDGIRGQGKYVGTYLAVAVLERYWWGEGEFKFYIDGDQDWPTICTTGTEDYFGGAWAFQERRPDGSICVVNYSTPYLGYPFYAISDNTTASPYSRDAVPMHGLYRWHLMDPVFFEQDLKVTVQQIGHDGNNLFERSDDVSSVAYWYQLEPHAPFPALLPAKARRPR
ncbi:glycoside hydrolase family 172 protein [Geochorda subterranea]|uniref:Glycoside hydrolase family 172 protein n=1 Tax=Geochorda subterranea TaxID=3109564 RepID=A0ABZ1BPR5_9FIRM|nr:glycoside hydrolase family 172 protein [Limnochorda sp. LNt]WRP14541.1 glycoside hydrolase family 172 protein [Limnochorda sp. LNt]